MANLQPIDINEAVKGWAEVTIDRFHEALDEYEIGKLDGPLWKSLAYELVQAGGNVEKVIIKFRHYGRFVDMGAGRGMPKGGKKDADTDKARRYGRKPKPWYSKTKTREAAILRQILIRDYGVNTLVAIESSFAQTETINPS